MSYDIAVIGAGPGGYVAAIHAAHKGKKVVLIEKDEVGGVCLNHGCIPTKSIAASAELLHRAKNAANLGVSISGEVSCDFGRVMERKSQIVAGLVKGIRQLIKGNKIDLIQGEAKFTSPHKLSVNGTDIEASNIIIATGSSWANIPGLDPDGELIVTSDHMLDLKTLPRKLLIVGGGVIGCEFASIMRTMGVEVTIVEMVNSLLSLEDAFVGKQLTRSFEKRGIKVFTGTTIKDITRDAGMGLAVLSNDQTIEADKILASVGRCPFVGGLGLEVTGVKTDRGFILVDEHLKTNVDHIYAIGDVIGNYMLAHVASEEGVVAVDNICGDHRKMSYDAVPRPIFTHPEIASVGFSEAQIKEKGIVYRTGRFSFMAIPKAVCEGDTDGTMQVHSAEDGKILGATIMGPHATDMISEVAVAIQNGLFAKDVAHTIHAHPTNSEIVKEAVEDTFGASIHKIGLR
jgi:dihydrolipoamide dehydrogenase